MTGCAACPVEAVAALTWTGLAWMFFICQRHDVLPSNITFQDNLLHALLSVDWLSVDWLSVE